LKTFYNLWTGQSQNGAFATALLPNVFGALLLGDLKSFVNARGGIFLHAGQT
jgi:hypothetical protein